MIALIAAVAKNNVIGSSNDLPWYLPEDLKHFREITTGHIVVMGRKTYESIFTRLGKPLPNRTNIVLTRRSEFSPAGVEVFHELEDVLETYQNNDIFFIGGGQIFKEALPYADTLFITKLNDEYNGDSFFPEIDTLAWELTEEEKHEKFSFQIFKKRLK